MKCPFCGKETERGYLYGRMECGLMWLPANKKPPLLLSKNSVKRRRGLLLGERPGLKITRIELHICRSCRKGITVF